MLDPVANLPTSPFERSAVEEEAVLHECPDCGLVQQLPTPLPGTNQCCVRCHNVLRRVQSESIEKGLAWSLSGLFFFFLTVTSPMLSISVFTRSRSGTILTGPLALDDQGNWLLSSVIVLTTIVMPFLKIAGTTLVLGLIYLKRQPGWLAKLFAFLRHMRPWVMIEIYLLGFLVAYSRLLVISHVHLALAVLGLVGLMVSIIGIDVTLDPEAVWEKIRARRPVSSESGFAELLGCDTCEQVLHARDGDLCPRCSEPLSRRKPNSLTRAWALGTAAALLYVPSNTIPIMQVTKLAKVTDYTIYGGIEELLKIGLWPLAILVFCASIVIPVFKLVALFVMLIHTRRKSRSHLLGLTRLYRVIEFIGRWSMVDVFVVSILVALVRFGWFAQITSDWGALYFASVVILTIVAVRDFDPRLMWDVQAENTDKELTARSPQHSLPA